VSPIAIPRTLGLADLVLLGTVAIVNVNIVPSIARFGHATLALWVVAWAAFLIPEAIAVRALSRRYPGEGGVYLWSRRHFGDFHGFLSGWCYWTNNLFYVPVLLVYLAGVTAYAGGSRTASLVDDPWFVATVAFGWLSLITIANIRGMAVGKWINNAGGIGSLLTVVLLLVAAVIARGRGVATEPPAIEGSLLDMASSLSVMCFAFIGIELAATMGDEIRNPERDMPRAVGITCGIALASYLFATFALITLVPAQELGAIEGIMQGVSRGAMAAGVGWVVAPVAIVMAISIAGAASAWFAGPARIPFAAGLDRALPPALGRVHPRWGSPHIALTTCALISAGLTGLSLAGSTVAEAYEILLRATVVINLVPFVYLFVALTTLDSANLARRAAGIVGTVVTAVGMAAAFVPSDEVADVAVFELKMVTAVGGLVAAGVGLYWRTKNAERRTKN
jgi:amino acid transporter